MKMYVVLDVPEGTTTATILKVLAEAAERSPVPFDVLSVTTEAQVQESKKRKVKFNPRGMIDALNEILG